MKAIIIFLSYNKFNPCFLSIFNCPVMFSFMKHLEFNETYTDALAASSGQRIPGYGCSRHTQVA